jgi:hypothetical protein
MSIRFVPITFRRSAPPAGAGPHGGDLLLSRSCLTCACAVAALVIVAAPAVIAAAPAYAATAPAPANPTVPSGVPLFLPCPPPTATQPPRIVTTPPGMSCRMLVDIPVGLPLPKGAPATGGGGMAAQVGSWK